MQIVFRSPNYYPITLTADMVTTNNKTLINLSISVFFIFMQISELSWVHSNKYNAFND